MDISKVLISPLISEKSLSGNSQDRYSFLVNPKANKDQIRVAIENMFGVEVNRVWTRKKAGKTKKTGKKKLSKNYSDQKLATVQLGKGQKIDLFDLKEK